MIKEDMKIHSPSRRNSRLISSTLILLGLILFLTITWKDYSETIVDAVASSSLLDNPTINKKIDDIPKNGKLNNNLLSNSALVSSSVTPTAQTSSTPIKNEMELNSIRVQEQISTILNEMSTDKILKPKKLLSPSKLKKLNPESASFDVETNFNEILNTSPVVLFIKTSDKQSNYFKNLLLREYEISPEVAVVDLDKHSNGAKLQEYIRKNKLMTKDQKLPYLFINSVAITNNDNLKKFHKDGTLLENFKKLGNGKIMFKKIEAPSNS
ncbi:hypothetical protein KAFR_0A03870 [Kazachstania africana CBS 2517]|uniref:Uncharacterized protein n=1 Tax=Kazachstania africana (strain ATCC 22294 / BCRC 22015 / CBS 2517 / CECT 1963 / NBRC 1671 / NRRL Y-8276) TaxID=1071382 RepID=H2AN72_KAZAF|nr:hypothetical protein KAFR_0A03870 [Kazachstania africana CBS 2517]CCF55822.1 hypothetical protein KAFR_0A03870 [Kazachstania africana CBS 2517]